MRNWARSTVIWCSLHWQHRGKWVPTLWVCVSNVCEWWSVGGCGTVRLDLCDSSLPRQVRERAGSSSAPAKQNGYHLFQEKASLPDINVFWSQLGDVMWEYPPGCPMLWWAHLSLSRARGWLEGSLSPAEMWGDQGLKADGLCLGWMQLSPWKNNRDNI